MIVFDEAMIISDPVENWPIVDALISFFSNGFPLQKAIEYKNLRKPFVVNDLEAQYILFDRYHNNSKYWDTQTSYRSCP